MAEPSTATAATEAAASTEAKEAKASEAEGTDTKTTTTDGEESTDLAHWKAMARKNEKAAKIAQDALDKTREAQMSEQDKAVEAAKREGRTEAGTAANARILKAEVKAAAAGKLADPSDAIQLLDLSDFTVSDDRDVDAKAIAKAIDGLVAAKPYLAVGASKTTTVPAGARSSDASGEDMNQRIRAQLGRS